jgi:hypothetical protein
MTELIGVGLKAVIVGLTLIVFLTLVAFVSSGQSGTPTSLTLYLLEQERQIKDAPKRRQEVMEWMCENMSREE